MRKKMHFLTALFLLLSFPVLAAEPVINLKKAEIIIETDSNKQYRLSEEITLTNIEINQDNTISHIFSNSAQGKLSNLKVTATGQELNYEMVEGQNLHKMNVQLPENATGDFTYEISYELTIPEDSFTTPLFVPSYPALGKENIVHIEFKAPEGEKINKNSFPVVIKSEENKVENNIMNIPSHVKYVYGDNATPFNIFNIVSWGVLIGLIAIIVSWFLAEVRKSKGVAV